MTQNAPVSVEIVKVLSGEVMPTSNSDIEAVEGQLLSAQRIGLIASADIPLRHLFAPGIYLREVTMPGGCFIIGHQHLTSHFNLISQGMASVMMNGKLYLLEAPHTFVSEAGVRKVLYVHQTMIWQTVHANPENIQDIPTLEAAHVMQSESFKKHLEELSALKNALENNQSRN